MKIAGPAFQLAAGAMQVRLRKSNPVLADSARTMWPQESLTNPWVLTGVLSCDLGSRDLEDREAQNRSLTRA